MMNKQPTVAAFVRVSADDQNDDLQRDALSRWAQAKRIELQWFADTFTGRTMVRPGWQRLWREVEAGRIDTVVVWKLDRLGRTAAGLATLFAEMLSRGIGFHSLTEGIDLTTASGRLMAHMLASVAEYEREIRGERQRAGIEAARLRHDGKCPWGGSEPGKPKKLKPEQVDYIYRAKAEGQGVSVIARTVGCARQTVYRVLSWRNGNDNG
jgi:DNA invertase Pin-like site-specific DNA recombinase